MQEAKLPDFQTFLVACYEVTDLDYGKACKLYFEIERKAGRIVTSEDIKAYGKD